MRGTIWKHSKTGGYYAVVELCHREKDGAPMVVYRNVEDGRTWVRPLDEWQQVVPIDAQGTHAPRFQMVGA